MKRMNQRLNILMGLLVAFGLMLVVNQQPVHAEKATYSVTPVYPENQTDPDLGYYDLKVTPKHEQEIALIVQNEDSKPAKIDVTPTSAITNSNGVIDYTQADAPRDSTLKNGFSDILSAPQHVVVAAHSSQQVTFTMKMPAERFDGVILGGFYISQTGQDQVEQALSRKNGAMLTNRYSYVLAAKVTESDKAVYPSLRLNRVRAGLLNSRTAILANVQNTKASSLGEMKVKAEIRKVGSNRILYQNKRSNLSMAPHSNFDYGISLKNKPLKSGKYNIKLRITSNKGNWTLSKNFTITQKEAAKYNDKAVELPKNNNWWLYVIIGVMVVLILILIYLLWRKSRKDQEQ